MFTQCWESKSANTNLSCTWTCRECRGDPQVTYILSHSDAPLCHLLAPFMRSSEVFGALQNTGFRFLFFCNKGMCFFSLFTNTLPGLYLRLFPPFIMGNCAKSCLVKGVTDVQLNQTEYPSILYKTNKDLFSSRLFISGALMCKFSLSVSLSL